MVSRDEPKWPMPPEWWRARRLELALAAAQSAVEALEQIGPSLKDHGAALDRAKRALAAAERRALPDWLGDG